MHIIKLPWPDSRLSPNYRSRSHWPVTAAKKAARHDAKVLATCAIPLAEKKTIREAEGSIALTITFVPPDRRQRDQDNMIASTKAMQDGIADALGVNDARFRASYVFAEPEKPGRVEVHVDVETSHPRGTLRDGDDIVSGPESLLTQQPGPDRHDEVTSHGS